MCLIKYIMIICPRSDMEVMLNKLAPEEGVNYTHTCEGPDDMPAHVKSTLIGSELTIPIHAGRLTLGRWQVRGS